MVFLETPFHVNTARDVSKLPWHKYLKGQYSKNNQPLNPSACFQLWTTWNLGQNLWQDYVNNDQGTECVEGKTKQDI